MNVANHNFVRSGLGRSLRFYLTASIALVALFWGYSAVRAADISFVDQATATGDATSVVVSKPTGTTDGDVMLGVVLFVACIHPSRDPAIWLDRR